MAPNMPGSWMPDDFERMWADLAPVGRSASSGGYFRQPFLSAERELAAWFEEQCVARGLTVERDAVGNVVAWWGARGSGRRGHRFAPRLGAGRGRVRRAAGRGLRARGGRRAAGAGLRAVAADRASRCSWRRRGRGSGWPAWARGWRPARCRGSGRGSCATATGCSWPTRLEAAGLPGSPARALLDGVGTFVELHVEQGRDLVDRSARGRGRERDLAARAVPLRVPRRRRPRRARRGWRTAPTRC